MMKPLVKIYFFILNTLSMNILYISNACRNLMLNIKIIMYSFKGLAYLCSHFHEYAASGETGIRHQSKNST